MKPRTILDGDLAAHSLLLLLARAHRELDSRGIPAAAARTDWNTWRAS